VLGQGPADVAHVPVHFRLLFVDDKGRAYNRSVFNMGAWKRALVAAGVIPPRERGARYLQAAPQHGMHALRHRSINGPWPSRTPPAASRA
jgi:hypothetical protein